MARGLAGEPPIPDNCRIKKAAAPLFKHERQLTASLNNIMPVQDFKKIKLWSEAPQWKYAATADNSMCAYLELKPNQTNGNVFAAKRAAEQVAEQLYCLHDLYQAKKLDSPDISPILASSQQGNHIIIIPHVDKLTPKDIKHLEKSPHWKDWLTTRIGTEEPIAVFSALPESKPSTSARWPSVLPSNINEQDDPHLAKDSTFTFPLGLTFAAGTFSAASKEKLEKFDYHFRTLCKTYLVNFDIFSLEDLQSGLAFLNTELQNTIAPLKESIAQYAPTEFTNRYIYCFSTNPSVYRLVNQFIFTAGAAATLETMLQSRFKITMTTAIDTFHIVGLLNLKCNDKKTLQEIQQLCAKHEIPNSVSDFTITIKIHEDISKCVPLFLLLNELNDFKPSAPKAQDYSKSCD